MALASSLFTPKPTNPLLCKPQNLNSQINPSLPSPIPLENLLNHYKSSQSQLSSPPSNFQLYDSLITRYRDSRSLTDAQEFHLQVLIHGFVGDLFLSNSLINVYVRAGDLMSARKLLDEMPERNPVTWACLISGYNQNGMPKEACGIFKEMVFTGFWPTHYAFGSVLRACQELGSCGLQFGLQIHGLILKSRYSFDVVVCNVLISMYGNCLGCIADARRVFDDIQFIHKVGMQSAFELFSGMQIEGIGFSFKPNEYTFGSLITAACSSFDFGFCLLEQMLSRITKSGFLLDLYVGSALVSGFARLGLTNYAMKIFGQMNRRNAVSMNGLMVGLVRQKRGEEAAEVFMEMTNLVYINFVSYVILLNSFAEFPVLERGRRKGREVHGYLIRRGLNVTGCNWKWLINILMINKDLVSWNTMISGLDQNE
ncbi:hypothetical protein CRYUN_Cryun23aG0046900 [Craigia yunnanensis]